MPRACKARVRIGILAAIFLAGCFTEVGNPGKPQEITASFHIDYQDSEPLKKDGGSARQADTGELKITWFYFNVVEANYSTAEDKDARIWKVADSLGTQVDFTGLDTAAALPPVQVPPGEWTFLKIESRIPEQDTVQGLSLDTFEFESFARRGYIKGYLPASLGGKAFLCALPTVYRINLVFEQELLSQWRHGDDYHIDVVFFASRWIHSATWDAVVAAPDRTGRPVVLIDLFHNRAIYDQLRTAFFKAFNSSKVWKENPYAL